MSIESVLRDALDTAPIVCEHDMDFCSACIAEHLAAALRAAPLDEQDRECDCYPGGFTPDSFEGPQEHCPVHGREPGMKSDHLPAAQVVPSRVPSEES